ncbi:MAG: hypothetical protein P4L22_07540 [Candidatus Babeliales bacterium]|nr:hypothetical protein [Candidatus Babeliales bacterium]
MKFIIVLLFVLFANLYCADPSERISPRGTKKEVVEQNRKIILKISIENCSWVARDTIAVHYYLSDTKTFNWIKQHIKICRRYCCNYCYYPASNLASTVFKLHKTEIKELYRYTRENVIDINCNSIPNPEYCEVVDAGKFNYYTIDGN